MKELAMKTTFLVFGLVVGAIFMGCGGGTDAEIASFRDTAVDDEGGIEFANFTYDAKPAGESQVIERAFENAPPMISHDVEGMMEITKDMNMCVTCHAPEFAEAMKATPVPASHLYDTFSGKKGKKVGKAIVDSRYNCNLCHAPMTNATPLIGNNFKPDFRSESDKKKSNLLDVLNEGAKIP